MCTSMLHLKFGKIKPVTVTSGQAWMYCDFGDAGNENEMHGSVQLGKNGNYEEIRSFNETKFKQYQWDPFNSTGKSFKLENKTDSICYKSVGMYEKDTTNKDWCANASGSIALSELKEKGRSFTYEIWGSGSNKIGLKIVLNMSD